MLRFDKKRLIAATLTGAALSGAVLAAGPAVAETNGLPQMRQTDTFASQIFWLIVTFGALYVFMTKVALPRITNVMEERQSKIEGDLARAERLKQEAEQVLAEYESTLQEAHSDAQKTLKEASDQLAKEHEERRQTFSQELDRKVEEAEARIEKAKLSAFENLDAMAVEAAQIATAKLIGGKVAKRQAEEAVKHVLENGR